ncbi:MAG: hypothetical protein JO327_06265 [Nitrososphaeraceae archaeon]|nr:hypothetical protein [Nitrososphaeraceae archaeon]MBV9667718.1 hypothetical protein [Nitrososphaeraceae archaeon]
MVAVTSEDPELVCMVGDVTMIMQAKRTMSDRVYEFNEKVISISVICLIVVI